MIVLNIDRTPIFNYPKKTLISVLNIAPDLNKPTKWHIGTPFQSSPNLSSPTHGSWRRGSLKMIAHSNLDLMQNTQDQVYPYVPKRAKVLPMYCFTNLYMLCC